MKTIEELVDGLIEYAVNRGKALQFFGPGGESDKVSTLAIQNIKYDLLDAIDGWIPVEEALPPADKCVLAQRREENKPIIVHLGLLAGNFCWFAPGLCFELEEMVCWRPCPRPYQPKGGKE